MWYHRYTHQPKFVFIFYHILWFLSIGYSVFAERKAAPSKWDGSSERTAEVPPTTVTDKDCIATVSGDILYHHYISHTVVYHKNPKKSMEVATKCKICP